MTRRFGLHSSSRPADEIKGLPISIHFRNKNTELLLLLSIIPPCSHRVTFRNLSNINDETPLQKQSSSLTRWLFPLKKSTADLWPDSKCGLTRGDVNLEWVDELQLHGIGSHRLVYKEVVEVRSNYKKSYFWWFGILAFGDSAGSNQIEKDKFTYLIDLFEGMGKKGTAIYCVEHL